jgi:GAF domain-containing protein
LYTLVAIINIHFEGNRMADTNVGCISLEGDDEVILTPLEYSKILDIQHSIFELLTVGYNEKEVLTTLCEMAEKLLPNSVASVMILDNATGLMSVISAPSIPQVGHDALQGLKPGPGGGSCGNAVFRNEAQYVKDTKTDARWTDIRQIAFDFNLRSCWSMPIRNADKQAIGSFALSSFEHRSPSGFHKRLLENYNEPLKSNQ